MHIVKAYKTSRGYFDTLEEANKKKNREKISSDRWGFSEYEKPKEVYLLAGYYGKYFELNEVSLLRD